jgi:hypothetical protein
MVGPPFGSRNSRMHFMQESEETERPCKKSASLLRQQVSFRLISPLSLPVFLSAGPVVFSCNTSYHSKVIVFSARR